jgi:hypothetical protein
VNFGESSPDGKSKPIKWWQWPLILKTYVRLVVNSMINLCTHHKHGTVSSKIGPKFLKKGFIVKVKQFTNKFRFLYMAGKETFQ